MGKKETLFDKINVVKAAGLAPDLVGIKILSAVLQNELQHNDAYRRTGLVEHFRNLECNSIERCIDRLADFVRSRSSKPQAIEFVLTEPERELLEHKVEVYHLYFIVDASHFLYSRKVPYDEISQLLGEKAYNVIGKHNGDTAEETSRGIYKRYLESLRRAIADEYHIDLR